MPFEVLANVGSWGSSGSTNLIDFRKKYIQGDTDILTVHGDPYIIGDPENIYVVRRGGEYFDGRKTGLSGAILVLNNHDSQVIHVWVRTGGVVYKPWRNILLTNICDPEDIPTMVFGDGRVQLSAPPRGYSIYVQQEVAFLQGYYKKLSIDKEKVQDSGIDQDEILDSSTFEKACGLLKEMPDRSCIWGRHKTDRLRRTVNWKDYAGQELKEIRLLSRT